MEHIEHPFRNGNDRKPGARPFPAMAIACLAAALAVASPTLGATKPSATAAARHLPKAVLIAAAKTSPLKLIDNLATWCDGDATVAAWLTALTRRQARSIAGTAGDCELVNTLNPLDAGGGDRVQATITLEHPKNRADTPEIEIYLDDPQQDRPVRPSPSARCSTPSTARTTSASAGPSTTNGANASPTPRRAARTTLRNSDLGR